MKFDIVPLRIIEIQTLTRAASKNVGALADGLPIRFGFKMSGLVSLKCNKVLSNVWKVGFALCKSDVCDWKTKLE